jgi:hypothetical protein
LPINFGAFSSLLQRSMVSAPHCAAAPRSCCCRCSTDRCRHVPLKAGWTAAGNLAPEKINRWDPVGLMRDGVPPLTIGVTDWTGSWHPPATIPHGRLQHGNLVLHHLFAMLMRICINQPYTHTHSTYIYNYIYIININTCFFCKVRVYEIGHDRMEGWEREYIGLTNSGLFFLLFDWPWLTLWVEMNLNSRSTIGIERWLAMIYNDLSI